MPDKGVDFLISPDRKGDRVASNHFRLGHDPKTGLFLVMTNEKATVNFNAVPMHKESSLVVSSEHSVTIGVGALQFFLIWEVADKNIYNDQLQKYRKDIQLPELTNLTLVDLTPQTVRLEVAGYSIQPGFAKGAFGAIHSALHRSTKTLFACKIMNCANSHEENAARREIDMLRSMRVIVSVTKVRIRQSTNL